MKTRFDEVIGEQLAALRLLYEGRRLMPLLMLLYATIDVLGFVTAEDEDTPSGERFKAFVNGYMNRPLRGGATSSDLWGARCALLHTATPESDLSKKGKARQILYAWGKADLAKAEDRIRKSKHPEKGVAVVVEDLYTSMVDGIQRLTDAARKDGTLNARCVSRASQFYRVEPC